MGTKVHKVRPLDSEGKKKVLSNVVIARDGSKEGMLPLEDQAMAEPATWKSSFPPNNNILLVWKLQTCHKGSGLFKRYWMFKLK
jgi:hypothetical protein